MNEQTTENGTTKNLTDPWFPNAQEIFNLTSDLPEPCKPKNIKFGELICQTIDFGNHWQTQDGMPISDDIAASIWEASILAWLIQYCGTGLLSFEFWSNDSNPGIVSRMTRFSTQHDIYASGDGWGRAIVTLSSLARDWKRFLDENPKRRFSMADPD